MDSYQALAIAAAVIFGTGALAAATVFCVAAVCDWIDRAAMRRSRRAFEIRRNRSLDRLRDRLGLDPEPAILEYRKNGGLHFIRAGRYGAAVWRSRA